MQFEQPQATPEENAELERAWEACAEAIYGNERTHQAIVAKIDPNDKVGSVAVLVPFIITEVDKKIDIDEGVIGGLVPAVTDGLIELASKAKGIEFTDQEVQQVLGAAMESTLMAFGVDEGDYADFVEERGLNTPEARREASNMYKGMLGG